LPFGAGHDKKNTVSPANENAKPKNDPKITGATSNGELKKIPQEHGLPEDEKSFGSKREFKFPFPSPANEELLMKDATGGFQTLVDDTTRPEGVCKSFPIADRHTYTLGHH
ncbi:hypothetical protein DSO57_1038977, partial [Entomophthora muscae]